MSKRTLRVFLSSPGDVLAQRGIIHEVVAAVNETPPYSDKAQIELVDWMDAGVPLLGNMTPQEAINQGLALPSTCDIVVVIMWSRMGTPLPETYRKPDGTRYLSGTEWEYWDAYRASQERKDGLPFLLVYRGEQVPAFRATSREEMLDRWNQYERVRSFFAAFSNPDGSIARSYMQYADDDDLRQTFTAHLKTVLDRILFARAMPIIGRATNDWLLARTMDDARQAVVRFHGPKETVNAQGEMVPHRVRNQIYDWLSENDIPFLDARLVNDDPREQLQLEAAAENAIDFYEVAAADFGGATLLKLALNDSTQPAVVYFSAIDADFDMIPAHSPQGYPLFEPPSLFDNETIQRRYYEQMAQVAQDFRLEAMTLAESLSPLTITFGEQTFAGDMVITPNRLHASDLLRAMLAARVGRRVIMNFTGGAMARDKYGYPLAVLPENPGPSDRRSLLDQFVDEGNELRRSLINVLDFSVFLRPVYTKQAALQALRELLLIRGAMRPVG